jgi:nucleoside-diphosphate-sugar epimerase
MSARTLITGAGGYLGRRIARERLARGDAVLLWLHAHDEADFAKKKRALAEFLGFDAPVEYYAGDLAASDPFAQLDRNSITHIVHGAGLTKFTVDAASADAINRDGTHKLLCFAEQCPRLERVMLLSTVYASGLTCGEIAEAQLLRPHAFANHYERSKWESEQLVADRFAHLPWTIARLSTVISDDETGSVGQFNAVHQALSLCFYGLMSVMPGVATCPLYFLTGAFAANSCARLLERAPERTVLHVCHDHDASPTLGEFIDIIYDTFARDPGFARNRVLKPLFIDQATFAELSSASKQMAGDPVARALVAIEPFAPELSAPKNIGNHKLRHLLPDYRAPDLRPTIAAMANWLVRTRWGRRTDALAMKAAS